MREDTRDDHEEGQVTRKSPRSPLVGLKALEFLSIHDYHSPGKISSSIELSRFIFSFGF